MKNDDKENKSLKEKKIEAILLRREYLENNEDDFATPLGWINLSSDYIDLIEMATSLDEKRKYSEDQIYAFKKITEFNPDSARYWFVLSNAYLFYYETYVKDEKVKIEGLYLALDSIEKAIRFDLGNEEYHQAQFVITQYLNSLEKKVNKFEITYKKVVLPTNLIHCYRLAKFCDKKIDDYELYCQFYFTEIKNKAKELPQQIKNLLPEAGLNQNHTKTNRALYLVRIFMFMKHVIEEKNAGTFKNLTINQALSFGAEMITEEIIEMNKNGKSISSLKGIFGEKDSVATLYKNKGKKYSLENEINLINQLNDKIKNELRVPTFKKEEPDNQTVFESELGDTVLELKKPGLIPFDLEGESKEELGVDLNVSNFEKNYESDTIFENKENFTKNDDEVELDYEILSKEIGEDNVFSAVDIALNKNQMNVSFISNLIMNKINEFENEKMFVCQVPTGKLYEINGSHFVCITKTASNEITIWDPLTKENAQELLYEPSQEIKRKLSEKFSIKEFYGEQNVLDASACGKNCIKYYRSYTKKSEKQDVHKPSDNSIFEQNRMIQEQNKHKNILQKMESLNKKHKRSLTIDEEFKNELDTNNKSQSGKRHYNDSSNINTGSTIKVVENRVGKGRLSERELIANKGGDRSFSEKTKHVDDKIKKFMKAAISSLRDLPPNYEEEK